MHRKFKLGTITVGQSPREDVIPEMLPHLGPDVDVIQAGALDGLEYEDILEMRPQEGDYVLVSSLRDGRCVKLAEKHILSRLQTCIDKLEQEGADIIVFICTGTFPDVFRSTRPLVYPQKILHSVVPLLTKARKIGVVIPDADQIQQTVDKWRGSGVAAIAMPFSPYEGSGFNQTSLENIKKSDVDLIVMDCIGYTASMKELIACETEKPVILARTMVARILGEICRV